MDCLNPNNLAKEQLSKLYYEGLFNHWIGNWPTFFSLFHKSHEVSEHCCRGACQILVRLKNSGPESRGLETSRDLVERRPATYWEEGQNNDVIMGAMTSQITSLTIVYSSVYSGTDQRKHQNSASLAFVRGLHRWPVNSPHKRPVKRKMFLFNDVIMGWWQYFQWRHMMVLYITRDALPCYDSFVQVCLLKASDINSRPIYFVGKSNFLSLSVSSLLTGDICNSHVTWVTRLPWIPVHTFGHLRLFYI